MNLYAVLSAAVSSFLPGGLWYSPLLFGRAWNRENGGEVPPGHPGKAFGIGFVFSLLAARAFAWLLGPQPELRKALLCGGVAGLGLVATSFGINYQFARRSGRLWAIDGGYHSVQFVLFGLILGLWH